VSLDPGGLPAHLHTLDARWDTLLDELNHADKMRRDALYEFEKAYATAYTTAPVAQSADSLRKQMAISQTVDLRRTLEHWDSEVKFKRDEMRALAERVSVARSLYAGVRSATT
jgi:hypothetical protein